MATRMKNVVGYCFSSTDLFLDDSNSHHSKLIKHCLEDDHMQEHFTEIKKIGKGGFGKVYSAKHRIDSQAYALKILPINSKEEFLKREVEVLSSLDHRNIVRYFGSWISKPPPEPTNNNSNSTVNLHVTSEDKEDEHSSSTESESSSNISSAEEICDACLVIQTELCKTEKNLRELIDENTIFTMENKQRRNIILDIIWGLQHIHDKGFMHRDLKPPNIFIDRDLRAKIGDFGFARNYFMSVTNVADGDSPTSNKNRFCLTMNIGTALYVAPEVRNTTCYDTRADLYGLGMIIFEVFYKMDSRMERSKTMGRLREPNFADLKKIPEKYRNVREIVESLLNHEPSMRMELQRVVTLMDSPLAHQQSEEKTKIDARPFPFRVEQAQISETIGDMQQEGQSTPFDFQDMKDSVKIHIGNI